MAENAQTASEKANIADTAANTENKEVDDIIASIQELAINIEQAAILILL